MKAIRVVDHLPRPIDTLRPGWFLWDVTVQTHDGKYKDGTMQGDSHGLWALDTFEEEQ